MLVVEVKYGKSKLGRTRREVFAASEEGDVARRVTRRGTRQFSPDWFRDRLNELASKGGDSTRIANRMRAAWTEGRIVAQVIYVDRAGNVEVDDRTEQWRRAGMVRRPSHPAGTAAPAGRGTTTGRGAPVPTARGTTAGGTAAPMGPGTTTGGGSPAPQRARSGSVGDRATSARVATPADPASVPRTAAGGGGPAPASQAGPRLRAGGLGGARGAGGVADLLHTAARMGVAASEARRAEKAFHAMLPAVERYRSEGYWVALTLVVERPIRTDLTGFDNRLRFTCWQLEYGRTEAAARGNKPATIGPAPSREETRGRRSNPCQPSRADWELVSLAPIVFPPYEEFARAEGFGAGGTYEVVSTDFGGVPEPAIVRARRLTIIRIDQDAPPRLTILDLSSGERLGTYVIRQTDRIITVLIGSPRRRASSESTFMRLASPSGDNLVLEMFRGPHTGGRAGIVLWRAIR
ncbi:MAG: hypothetical protein KY452_00180 [Actinobacteria bacterium]|nr:hypothetical protein [Actinomycetota bacterium]